MLFWWDIRHLNLLTMHPERIKKADRKVINDLDYANIIFRLTKKDYSRIPKENSICINVFCCENDLVYPICVS